MNTARKKLRGFTLIELLLSVAITGIIAAAVGSFVYGVGQGWSGSEAQQSVFVAGSQATGSIQRLFSSAKTLGYCRSGSLDNSSPPAQLTFWAADNNSDSSIQISEMAMLGYDPGSSTLYLYQVHFPTSWTNVQRLLADITITPANLLDPMTLLGNGYTAGVPLVRHVSGAQFVVHNAASTSERPSVEFSLRMDNGQAAQIVYGTATLRCPNNQPM